MADEPQVILPRDPVVARVNSLTTTFLDAVGTLLLATAAGWGAWRGDRPAWGFAAAGLVVMLLSTVAQSRQNPRPARVPKGAHPRRETLPGPDDAGNVHVMGR